jgi:hypothetical protein
MINHYFIYFVPYLSIIDKVSLIFETQLFMTL